MKKFILGVLMIVGLVSCDNHRQWPSAMVYEGNSPLIVYKVELVNNADYGKYRYAVTDASKVGWTLISNSKYNVGDTLKITK